MRKSPKHREFLEEIRKKGYRDWHIALIVCNTVANYISSRMAWRGSADDQYMRMKEEATMNIISGKMNQQIEMFVVDEIETEEFRLQKDFSFIVIMKTWGIVSNSPVPVFEPIKEFMRERYKLFEADVPHDQLFQT